MTSPLKTYSHLAGARRLPTDYEVVTSDLHWYVGRGFEVAVPLADWYRRHQTESPLRCSDWGRFRDPRETTYTHYTNLQLQKESHVERVLRSMEEGPYQRELPPAALDLFERALAPLRFPFHGLQMAAAYVGQMAPEGRITIVAALQAADELRRIQRIAYRLAQLRRLRPGLGDDGRTRWQRAPEWQPLRRLVETLLVTYDWGEAFTALDLCAKPILDRFTMVELPALARSQGDYLLGELFFSLAEDCAWHRQWSEALVQTAVGDQEDNREVLRGWVRRWLEPTAEAVRALARALPGGDAAPADRAISEAAAWLTGLGIAP